MLDKSAAAAKQEQLVIRLADSIALERVKVSVAVARAHSDRRCWQAAEQRPRTASDCWNSVRLQQLWYLTFPVEQIEQAAATSLPLSLFSPWDRRQMIEDQTHVVRASVTALYRIGAADQSTADLHAELVSVKAVSAQSHPLPRNDVLLAKVLLDSGDFDGAIRASQVLLSGRADFTLARFITAACHFKVKSYQLVIDTCQEARRSCAREADPWTFDRLIELENETTRLMRTPQPVPLLTLPAPSGPPMPPTPAKSKSKNKSKNKSKRASTSAGKKASTSASKTASTSDRQNASTSDRKNASTSDGQNASTSDRKNASTSDGQNASTSDGQNASTSDGQNASTSDGQNASTSDRQNASTSDRQNASPLNDKNASTNDGDKASPPDVSSAGSFPSIPIGALAEEYDLDTESDREFVTGRKKVLVKGKKTARREVLEQLSSDISKARTLARRQGPRVPDSHDPSDYNVNQDEDSIVYSNGHERSVKGFNAAVEVIAQDLVKEATRLLAEETDEAPNRKLVKKKRVAVEEEMNTSKSEIVKKNDGRTKGSRSIKGKLLGYARSATPEPRLHRATTVENNPLDNLRLYLKSSPALVQSVAESSAARASDMSSLETVARDLITDFGTASDRQRAAVARMCEMIASLDIEVLVTPDGRSEDSEAVQHVATAMIDVFRTRAIQASTDEEVRHSQDLLALFGHNRAETDWLPNYPDRLLSIERRRNIRIVNRAAVIVLRISHWFQLYAEVPTFAFEVASLDRRLESCTSLKEVRSVIDKFSSPGAVKDGSSLSRFEEIDSESSDGDQG